MSPAAGQLRQWITVYRRSVTTNADGQRIEGTTSTQVLRCPAKVELLGLAEAEAGKQQVANTRCRFTLRSSTTSRTITAKMWIVDRTGARWNIEGVADPDGRGRDLVLDCLLRAL